MIDVIDVLTDLFVLRGPLAYICSNNGPELVADEERNWVSAVGGKMA